MAELYFYLVDCCPMEDANGCYMYDKRTGKFLLDPSLSQGVWALEKIHGCWRITLNGLCKFYTENPYNEPPSMGWKCWNRSKFTNCRFMTVKKYSRQNVQAQIPENSFESPIRILLNQFDFRFDSGILKLWVPDTVISTAFPKYLQEKTVQSWLEIEGHWCSSMESLTMQIAWEQTNIQAMKLAIAENMNIKMQLDVELQKLQEKLCKQKDMERKASHERAENVSLVGRNHIKRDVQQMIESTFPAGEDFKSRFDSTDFSFGRMEFFAVNVIESIMQIKGIDEDEAQSIFANLVMKKIHETAYNYVYTDLSNKRKLLLTEFDIPATEDAYDLTQHLDKKVHNLFWYKTMQSSYVQRLEQQFNNDEAAMTLLLQNCEDELEGKFFQQLQNEMLTMVGTNDLTIAQLVQRLLLNQAIALLSDPPCHLSPTPGDVVIFTEGCCREIFYDSRNEHMKVGDTGTVAFCGLFFDQPTLEEPQSAVAKVLVLNTSAVPKKRR